MAKKKRLKEDAFAWVKDTTAEAEEPKAAEPTLASRMEKEAQPPEEVDRVILVKYRKDSGAILATHEVLAGQREKSRDYWTDLAEGDQVAEISLPAELASQSLVEIHTNYVVVGSSKNARLARKE